MPTRQQAKVTLPSPSLFANLWSPRRSVATSVAGNAITAEAQRAKLALLVRAARDFLPA
jgi:hypothetical protein